MQKYEIVIGLEAHVQLLTETKVFCGCSTRFGMPPNTATCPVCLGLPGVLPVLNKKAFLLAVKTALAVKCSIQDTIKFDRKNYYYPDLPKNYQISQFDKPLGYDGCLEIDSDGGRKRIKIRRVHLEEDAGKLVHDTASGTTFVDFNRTGVPLLEIVSEPDLRSPDEASTYMQGLRSILRYLGVSDCNMEEGSLRCDANISVRKKGGSDALGVKTELKNMNSFKSVRDALSYEAKRQVEAAENGEQIILETRLWNEAQQITVPMRTKEESHDYRYFPEPDLLPFSVDTDETQRMRKELPELPRAKRERFISAYGITAYDADVLTRDRETADFFERAAEKCGEPKETANWMLGDVASLLNESRTSITRTPFAPEHLAQLVTLIHSGEITGKTAKEILPEVFTKGVSPASIVRERGLTQISDEEKICAFIEEALTEHAKSVADYKKGKANALTFLVGQVMRKTKGKANPHKVNEILKKRLEER